MLLESYKTVVKALLSSEDTLLATQVLSLLPSVYRDNPPKEIQDLKKLIHSKIFSTNDYITNNGDNLKPIEFCKDAVLTHQRFRIIHALVEARNKVGEKPHLIDMGPGDYCLPIGLSVLGAEFTYNPVGLQLSAMSEAKSILEKHWVTYDIKDRPNWFLAYEIIEHLHDVEEIRRTYDKFHCEKIFLSTPVYTFGEGNPNWDIKGIEHLRTYTPREFISVVQKLFPEYNLSYISDFIQIITGELRKA